MALLSAIGGTLLLIRGNSTLARLVSLAALVLWIFAVGFFHFGTLISYADLTILNHAVPLPSALALYVILSSLIMIALLTIGWKKH